MFLVSKDVFEFSKPYGKISFMKISFIAIKVIKAVVT